ncbi:hypothetical protein LMH73_022295 [Vibrio splendidus]|nr:hypothetical protein [Vibrio splendidus]MCC4880498.1 hypothetical protein [Vibrio splendidus]
MSADVLHAYESRSAIFSFSFYFPDAFDDYHDLVKKTDISVCVTSNSNYEQVKQIKKAWVKLDRLQDIAVKLSFFSDLYIRTKAENQNMRSPHSVWLSLFMYVAFNTDEDALYYALLANNESVEDSVSKCAAFTAKRAELNRAKKNTKKDRSKAEKSPTVIANMVRIRELEAEINRLKSENTRIIKESSGAMDSKSEEGVLARLMSEFRLSSNALASSPQIRKAALSSHESETVFLDIFRR